MNKTLPNGPDAWQNQKIILCAHEGYFVGDVIVTPLAVTVIAKKPVTPEKLIRSNLDAAQWRIHDRFGGYWSPSNGRFVLSRKAVERL